METPGTQPASKAQPIQTISADQGPLLDDAQVRAALMQAEANNQDPQTVTMDDFAKGQQAPAPKAPEVPQKFLKTDGAVDVEKIQASTRQLDEAIQKKEEAINKSVEDYLKAEQKFRNMPNPERVAASMPMAQAPAPVVPAVPEPPQNFEEIVRRDFQTDQLGTMVRLNQLMIEKAMAPIREREQLDNTRTNLQELAARDPRILREDVFAAINAKLDAEPELRRLKNPHKAAWLEVKEEMRLGDVPQGTQAQPSRPLSPVLGGGTPPSAPSSSVPQTQDVLSNLHKLDLRDKAQEALGDEAIRRQLMGNRG
jgi:hypothetical protein